MKTLLIPIILLFASCSKMEEIIPEPQKGVIVEVQTINSTAVVMINGSQKNVGDINSHGVSVFDVKEITNLAIFNTGAGEVTAVITDNYTKSRIKTGNINNFLRIK